MTRSRRERSRIKDTVGLVGLCLVAAAVVKELRTPSGLRTWQGELFGFVPYDLRRPTPSRIRDSLWQPGSDQIFLPRSFGVGWSVNFARVVELAGRRDADS